MVREVPEIGQLEFAWGFIFCPFLLIGTRRRRGGNVGTRRFLPDLQARWEEWETRLLSFPRFPRRVISTALFIRSCSERSDADGLEGLIEGMVTTPCRRLFCIGIHPAARCDGRCAPAGRE